MLPEEARICFLESLWPDYRKTVQKDLVRVRNGYCYDLVQSNRARRMDFADFLLVEVGEREVGLHLHWMVLGSSLTRPGPAALEHGLESLLMVRTAMRRVAMTAH